MSVIVFYLFLFAFLKTVYTGIDHHWKDPVFATCGPQVDIWDEQRTSPLCSLTWGVDSISSVKFNPVEVNKFIGNSKSLLLSNHLLKVCKMFKEWLTH